MGKLKKPVPETAADNHVAVPLQEKFAEARNALASALVERENEIDLVFAAMVCQENPLLVGPPGVGKSLLLDSLMSWMKGNKFSILLTKFSTPEEVYGQYSIKGLKEDQFQRVTVGKLAEAEGAFIDEIWKASSAILNTLLRILNERVYDKGDGVLRKVPLKLCVAASNEWPTDENGKELGALFDRFLFRKLVRPVSKSGRKELLRRAVEGDDCKARFKHTITPAEVDLAHAEAMALPFGNDAKVALWEILEQLNKEGIHPGDRRTYKSIAAARAACYLAGGSEVRPEHLEILAHVLWDDPTEQPEKAAKVVARIANPLGMRINEYLVQAEEVSEQCKNKIKEGNKDKATVAEEAVTKLREIESELCMLQPNARQQNVLQYVKSEIKSWLYRGASIPQKNKE